MDRKEVETWYSAYKIGWLVAKAPEGLNERKQEVPWVLKEAEELSHRGNLLDIGSYLTSLPDSLSNLGYQVTAFDLRGPGHHASKRVQFVTGDIRCTDFESAAFDIITCVSTIEHIGVKGRYGVTIADDDGDRRALDEMYRLLKVNGSLLLTVPMGPLDVLPANRCYNAERINLLTRKFRSIKREFFAYSKENVWDKVSIEKAEKVNWYTNAWYALGCFHFMK